VLLDEGVRGNQDRTLYGMVVAVVVVTVVGRDPPERLDDWVAMKAKSVHEI